MLLAPLPSYEYCFTRPSSAHDRKNQGRSPRPRFERAQEADALVYLQLGLKLSTLLHLPFYLVNPPIPPPIMHCLTTRSRGRLGHHAILLVLHVVLLILILVLILLSSSKPATVSQNLPSTPQTST